MYYAKLYKLSEEIKKNYINIKRKFNTIIARGYSPTHKNLSELIKEGVEVREANGFCLIKKSCQWNGIEYFIDRQNYRVLNFIE